MKRLSALRLRWSLLVLTLLTGGSLMLTGCSSASHSVGVGDSDHDGDANCFLLCDFDSDD